MTGAVEIADYSPGDRRDVLELVRRVWGTYVPEDDFRWWFEQNPAGTWLSLARADRRVVGVAALSGLRVRVRESQALAAAVVALATDPDYRGRRIMTRLQERNEARTEAELALIYPNANAAPIFGALPGWASGPSPRVWVRLLPIPLRPGPSVVRLEAFPDDLGALPRPAAAHALRDAAYLNWRYAASPRGYELLGVARGSRLAGYLVLRRRWRGVAVVADLVAEPRDALRLLAAATVRRPAIAVPPPALRRVFVAAGFAPTPKRLRFLFRPLGERRAQAFAADEWFAALGDLDFV